MENFTFTQPMIMGIVIGIIILSGIIGVIINSKRAEDIFIDNDMINSLKSLKAKERPKTNMILILSILISISVHLIFAAYLLTIDDDIPLAIVGPIFPAIGTFLLIDFLFYKIFNLKVEAIVREREKKRSSRNGATYSYTYIYKVNNETYTEKESYGTSTYYSIGKKVYIYLNPFNFKKFRNLNSSYLMLSLLFIFLGAGFIIGYQYS